MHALEQILALVLKLAKHKMSLKNSSQYLKSDIQLEEVEYHISHAVTAHLKSSTSKARDCVQSKSDERGVYLRVKV